jgi:outer membrane protein OmpA-like peptidoglycan-associated protein
MDLLQNRPPRVEVVEKEVVKTVEKISSVPTTIPFKFNSAVVDNIYEPMLFNIATFMKNNPETKVRIVGFADKFGPVNFNLQISKRRAEAIAKILNKEYGIENDRILVEGAGKEKPYYEKNNKWNRCAVVEVIR